MASQRDNKKGEIKKMKQFKISAILGIVVLLCSLLSAGNFNNDYRSAQAVKVATDFLNSNGSNLRLDRGVKLAVRDVATDELGMSHTKFQQYLNGVKVFGGELI